MATFTIMRLTFLEAVRRRIALAAILLGIAFLVLYGIAFYFMVNESELPAPGQAATNLMRTQVFTFLAVIGLYAVNFLGIALSALISADSLSGEIATGTIQAIVTKPLRRAEIVLGKWLGYAGLLAGYLGFMISGVIGLVYLISGYVVPNAWTGFALIFLECLVILTVTLLASSRFSTLATGGLVFGLWGLAFIGGFVEQIGALLRNATVVNVGIISSLLLPTEAIFRRAAYLMSSRSAQSVDMAMFAGPVFVISVPSALMVVYAFFYLGALLWATVRSFSRRDL
jgi:ABC-type transport system involved in multi-copper enzyme maturation permease subunit